VSETALKTNCGTCGKVIKFEAAMLGKSSKCPQCGEMVRLSDPNSTATVITAPDDKPATPAPAAPTTKDKVFGCGFGLVLLLLVSSCANYFWPGAEENPPQVAETEKPPTISDEEEREIIRQLEVYASEKRNKFMEVVAASGIPGIVSVDRKGDLVGVTVNDDWHFLPSEIRQMHAARMESIWARIASPDQPRLAMIKIFDTSGREVGGSRALGGVWVND